jgi:hypothetical protein
MAEELGKLEKPNMEAFKKSRKLYYIPLVFGPPEADDKFQAVLNRYWGEVKSHLNSLEEKLAVAKKVFHELVAEAGEDGLRLIEQLNSGSFRIVKDRVEKGAEIVAVEDAALLGEFMDWGRCLASGLRTQKVFTFCYESYVKAQEQRNEFITKKISETLVAEEAAILIMREGHHIQFPIDLQVFYVSPPALDEIRRLVREQEAAMTHEHEHEGEKEKK